MKIEYKKECQTMVFSLLDVGQCFVYNGALYVKTYLNQPCSHFSQNALNLTINGVAMFQDKESVLPVEAEIVVK